MFFRERFQTIRNPLIELGKRLAAGNRDIIAVMKKTIHDLGIFPP